MDNHSPLFGLPAELRNRIYHEVARNTSHVTFARGRFVPHSLARTSKQLRVEFHALFEATRSSQTNSMAIIVPGLGFPIIKREILEVIDPGKLERLHIKIQAGKYEVLNLKCLRSLLLTHHNERYWYRFERSYSMQSEDVDQTIQFEHVNEFNGRRRRFKQDLTEYMDNDDFNIRDRLRRLHEVNRKKASSTREDVQSSEPMAESMRASILLVRLEQLEASDWGDHYRAPSMRR